MEKIEQRHMSIEGREKKGVEGTRSEKESAGDGFKLLVSQAHTV